MSDRVVLKEADDLNARFPAERIARVTLRLADGRVFRSEATPARGDAERPLSDAEIMDKYMTIAEPALGGRAAAIAQEIGSLPARRDTRPLLELLLEAP
jgi:2-methylcitrate dehydratase PrpD